MPSNFFCGNGIFCGVAINLSTVSLLEYLILIPPFLCVPVMRDCELLLNLKGNKDISKWKGSLEYDFNRWLIYDESRE